MVRWFGYALMLLLFAEMTGLLTVYVRSDSFPSAPSNLLELSAFAPFGLSLLLTLCCLVLLGVWTVIARRRDGSPEPRVRPVWAPLWAVIYVLWGLSATLTASAFLSTPSLIPRPVADRSAVIVAVNDIYRIEGVEGGGAGGLARLRTIRAELEQANPGKVLFLHGGDVIFPSLLSRMYAGRQMIDVLNLMDGDPEAGRLDERMFVVLGNHEFDQESCTTDSPLQTRVAESDFYWLHSNIALNPCPDGRPRLVGANLLQAKLIEVGGIRIGLFGLTIDSQHPSFRFMDALETAGRLTVDLRRRGAEVVIALTHLNRDDDWQLYQALRGQGLDLIVGGHDHTHMHIPAHDPRIFKADADAVTAWVIELKLTASSQLKLTPFLRELRGGVPQDPLVQDRVAGWMRSHEAAFCKAADHHSPQCLSVPLGVSATRLVANEEQIRGAETSLGNWVADQMVEAFKDCGVEAAFINSGALRLNQDLPQNSEITRRHIEELVQYPTPLYLLELSQEQLQRAIQNSISLPGSGRWLQVSRLAFVYEPDTQTVLKLRLKPPAQDHAIDVGEARTRKFRVVASKFMTVGEVDGYHEILPPIKDAIDCKASGIDLKTVLYRALESQKRIAPEAEGRVCTAADAKTKRCQADT